MLSIAIRPLHGPINDAVIDGAVHGNVDCGKVGNLKAYFFEAGDKRRGHRKLGDLR